MKQELRDKWVAALVSGEYQQGQSRLRNTLPDGSRVYCCLGVLCDLAGVGEWVDEVDEYHVVEDGEVHELDTELGVILGAVGLTRANEHDLIESNDDKQWSFARIATLIEADVKVTP